MDFVNVFVTLFDSNYLDKGLILYESLESVMDDFRLYIVAFDDKSYEVLNALSLDKTIIVSVEDILNEKLKTVRKTRGRAEFSYTCSPFVVDYVLNKMNEQICTYIDSDLYFYKSPEPLIRKLTKDNSVGITSHNFLKDCERPFHTYMHGKYCVEFNTFVNDEKGQSVLKSWKEQCLNDCPGDCKDGILGDQRYLDKWPYVYEGVKEYEPLGLGVGPWNLSRFKVVGDEIISDDGDSVDLYFYHFQKIKFYEDGVCLNITHADKIQTTFMDMLYKPYLEKTLSVRRFLKEKFNVEMSENVEIKEYGNPLNGVFRDVSYWQNREMRESAIMHTLNHWLRIKQQGKNVSEYFEKYGFRNIAVYGMGMLGDRLVCELDDSEVKVLYGIDRHAGKLNKDIEVYAPCDELPKADAVVLTTFMDELQICKLLEGKGLDNIISLVDILDCFSE